MTPDAVLAELESLARRLGVPVRFEPFNAKNGGKGGLCRLKGEKVIVIDVHLPVLDKVGVLAEALSKFDLEAIYLPPILRARIEGRRSPVAPILRPPAKAFRRA